MPQIFYINDWSEQPFYSTGGTRDKKIFLNPAGEKYYFKRSYLKGERDYKYEFWSEIIACEYGKQLGFDMLTYDIGVFNGIVGCISKSMTKDENEELMEGGKYLQAYDIHFNQSDKANRKLYTYQLIKKALTSLQLEKYIDNIIEVIIFDALIGNSDRHQENWAFLIEHTYMSKVLSDIEYEIEQNELKGVPKFLRPIIKGLMKDKAKSNTANEEIKKGRLQLNKSIKFAPIYDSGCSMGRELKESAVEELIQEDVLLEKYIKNGAAEIHWEGKKLNHFEFVSKIAIGHKDCVEKVISRVASLFYEDVLRNIVYSVDNQLSPDYEYYKIPQQRKELIVKLLTLRATKLISLLK